jgi:hypothetical protein
MGSPYNLRIKLTACGTRSHGKKRRLSHAAAYPRRYTDLDSWCSLRGFHPAHENSK